MATLGRRGFIGGLAAVGVMAAVRPPWALGQPTPGRRPATPARLSLGPTFPRVHRSILEEPTAGLKELADLIREYSTDDRVGPHNLHNCAHGFGMAGIGVLPGNGTRFFTWHREYLARLSTFLAEHQRTLPSWAPWEKIPKDFLRPAAERGRVVQPAAPPLGWANAFVLWSHELIGYWPNLDVMGSQLSWSAHLQVHIACQGEMAIVQRAPHAPIFWPWHTFIDDLYADRLDVESRRPPGGGPLPPPEKWPWLDQGPDDPLRPPQPGDDVALAPWCYGLTRDEAEQRIRDAGLVVGDSARTIGGSNFVCGQLPRPFTRQKKGAGVVDLWGMVSEVAARNQGRGFGFGADLLGGLFHLELENGTVSYGQLGVAVQGSVILTSVPAPTLTLALKDAKLALESARCPEVMEQPRPELSARVRGEAPVVGHRHGTAGASASVPGWYTISGTATLEIRWGALQLLIPDVTLTHLPDGALALKSADADLLGCRHGVGEGSKLLADQIQVAGSLRCGEVVMASSVLEASPTGIRGGGKLVAHGHTFDVTYGAAGGALTAAGAWTGQGTGWRAVPSVQGVEFQLVNPRVQVEVTAAPSQPRLETTLVVDRIEARTTAVGADGKPLAYASLQPAPLSVAADGAVVLPLPGLPTPPPIPGPHRGETLCDASCSVLARYHLEPLVPTGTGFGSVGGSLKYKNGEHAACRIEGGPLNGKCEANTACGPGGERYLDGDVWKCREQATPVNVPKLPASISAGLGDLIR